MSTWVVRIVRDLYARHQTWIRAILYLVVLISSVYTLFQWWKEVLVVTCVCWVVTCYDIVTAQLQSKCLCSERFRWYSRPSVSMGRLLCLRVSIRLFLNFLSTIVIYSVFSRHLQLGIVLVHLSELIYELSNQTLTLNTEIGIYLPISYVLNDNRLNSFSATFCPWSSGNRVWIFTWYLMTTPLTCCSFM